MATAKTPIPEEGAEDTTVDYYDIMVIGRTGMGKSTTSDKLVIANLDGRDYSGEQHTDELEEAVRVKTSDLSMWLIADEDEIERVKVRLKNLVLFRSLKNPHIEVNVNYKGSSRPTTRSQLISNESTNVRILDVPGFFGEDIGNTHLQTTGNKVTTSGLCIMREILRIQATMRMKFRRIVYFIPERGPLERSQNKVLQMELEQMVHYFGKSIFECMVLVATVNPDVYQYLRDDAVPFSENAEMTTRMNFQEALTRVLPPGEQPTDGKPPIVFISMHDTCEAIIEKIKNAPVIRDELELAFDDRTCVRCGLKAKILTDTNNEEKRVACYAGEDPSKSVPYDESKCHPIIISKYWMITKIVGGIAHFITRGKFKDKWPDFRNPDDEICIDCRKVPSEPGCKKVGSRYRLYDEIRFVDHSPTEEPCIIIDMPQQQQPDDDEHIAELEGPDQHRPLQHPGAQGMDAAVNSEQQQPGEEGSGQAT